MSFRPIFPRDRIWAGLSALVLLLLALLFVLLARHRALGPGVVLLGGLSLLLLGLSARLIYHLWSLHTLDYWVQRDAIHIHWHGEDAVIPLLDVVSITPATQTLAPHWVRWPRHWVQTDAENSVLSYSAQPPAKSLAIVTGDETYLISPAHPAAFIDAFEERQQFGPARHLKPVIYLSAWRQHWLLRDKWAQWLLLGGLALGWLVLAFIIWRYPHLPAQMPLHIDASGHPDAFRPQHAIFLLPGIALLIGFLNAAFGFALYAYHRFLAYLLWSVSVILQFITLLVAANLIKVALGG